MAQNGRYGPYVKKGAETRSLETEEQLFTITLEEALGAARQAEAAPRPRAAKPPLRELGADPASGKPIVLKDGRFGPYVTDGETNASLRRGDDPETRHDRARGRAARRPALERPRAEAQAQRRQALGRVVRTNVQTFRANWRLSLRGRDQTR